jgi:hypothetical protein
MKAFYLLVSVMMVNVSAMASEIVCVDRNIQDAQFTALFQINNEKASVEVDIPTDETSTEQALGECVSEEDVDDLSLRCDSVVTRSGVEYFARIDNLTATVSRDGQIITTIPCTLKM